MPSEPYSDIEAIYNAGYKDGEHDGYHSTLIADGREPEHYGRGLEELHRIINRARTVKAIPLKDIEKMRTEILKERRKNMNMEYDKIFELCILIIDKYKAESEDEA